VHTWNVTGLEEQRTSNTQPALYLFINGNYVNNNFEHIAQFPAIDLSPNDVNIFSLNARLVELQEHSQDCTNKVNSLHTHVHIIHCLFRLLE
jgi:hypothetical protein